MFGPRMKSLLTTAAVSAVSLMITANMALAGGYGNGGYHPPPSDLPEPTTLGLLGLGIAGLMLARRRK